jgi:hypothetical protein
MRGPDQILARGPQFRAPLMHRFPPEPAREPKAMRPVGSRNDSIGYCHPCQCQAEPRLRLPTKYPLDSATHPHPGSVSQNAIQSQVVTDNLPRRPKAAKVVCMKCRLIALIVMLAIGLQSSVIAFAGIAPVVSTDCQTAAISQTDTSQDSCCPKGQRSMSCCLDACVATASVALMMTPQALIWHGRVAPPEQFRTTHFSSRGDSPLIRPPIL